MNKLKKDFAKIGITVREEEYGEYSFDLDMEGIKETLDSLPDTEIINISCSLT